MVSLRLCKAGACGAAPIAALVTTLLAIGRAAGGELAAKTPQQLLEQVDDIVAVEGPLSAELLEPFTGLALHYEERDDHVLALVALEQAMQVLRVNRGLYTLEQVPLLRRQLGNEEARGNDAVVWALEQELLGLARRHPDDVRAVPVLAELADRQMHVLERYIAGERPPALFYGCFYKQWPNSTEGSCTAGSRKIVVQGMLAEAQRHYSAAIGVLLRNGLFGSAELHELEMKLLRGVDLVRTLPFAAAAVEPVPLVPGYIGASTLEPWRGRIAPLAALAAWQPPQPGAAVREELGERATLNHAQMMSPYHRGRQSLRRLYAYSTASARPPLDQAAALVQIADWDLLYSHNGQAMSSYERTRDWLERAAVPQSAIASLFAPPMPVVLPAFRPNPLAPQDGRPAIGYIDVAFEITKYGRGRTVEIVGATNAPDRSVDELVAVIKASRFRPRLTEGRFEPVSQVAMRYYVYEFGE